jgi:hypothetical protein
MKMVTGHCMAVRTGQNKSQAMAALPMILTLNWLTQPILDFYRSLGGNLFPCRMFKVGDPQSKIALEGGYTDRFYNDMTLHGYADGGHPVGWCPHKGYFVVDVDYPNKERPNKRGGESLAQLEKDLGIDLSPFLTVTSPTGGKHFYIKKPEDAKLRGKLEDYPDIDIITGNKHVLIAGSPHWSGAGNYEFAGKYEEVGL